MAGATTTCPTCRRTIRSDRRAPDGTLHCVACRTTWNPDRPAPNHPATVSLGGVAHDAERPAAPTAVAVAGALERAGLDVRVDLPVQPPPKPDPGHKPPSTSAHSSSSGRRERPVAEVLRTAAAEGRYVVDGELGRGGMGAVLRVADRDLRRDVAMKVLHDGRSERERRRFIEEAQITGQLEHPNIVPVHELGVDASGRLYFTMKLVRGASLADILDRLRRKDPEAATWSRFRLLRVFIQICNATAFAHSRGVIHRDLKPANIMLGDYGEVLLADWGLARVLPPGRRGIDAPGATPPTMTRQAGGAVDEADDRLAKVVQSLRAGTVEGTPHYMPPEQARGDLSALDERSDVYALGAILYEILTLKPPVRGRTIDDVLENVINHRIPPPGARTPDRDVPADLSSICLKALSAAPEHRYQRALDLRADIEAHLEDRAVSARDESAFELMKKLLRRHKAAALVGVVAVGVLAVVLTVSFRTVSRERDAAHDAMADARRAADKLRDEKRDREREQLAAVPALIAKARSAIDTKEWEDARVDIDLALRYDAGRPEAHLLKALLLIRGRDFRDAAATIDTVIQLAGSAAGTAGKPVGEPIDPDLLREVRALCVRAADPDSVLDSALATRLADALVRLRAQTVAEDLFHSVRERVEVYRHTLERTWPGSTSRGFWADDDGMLHLNGLRGREDVTDLAALAGMPVVALDLAGTKLIDLGPLKGMPLTELDISRTAIRDLAPLAGAPLQSLRAASSRIADLAPLNRMPLEELEITDTPVADLAPLAGCPLRVLKAARSLVADIAPLTGMPLNVVDLTGTAVADLAPLQQCRISILALGGTRVADLAPLAGMSLTQLDLRGTRVADLAPLAGVPLRTLILDRTPVADLAPLIGANLVKLSLRQTAIADLGPLSGMPLTELDCAKSPVDDLGPLRRSRLIRLNVAGTGVSDLTPLAALPLAELDLSRTGVSDLSPLAGKQLTSLALDHTPVDLLTPLTGMPLKELRLAGSRVHDLTPILQCPLERLTVPIDQITVGIDGLRELTTLQRLGSAFEPERGWAEVPTPIEFWQRTERRKEAP